MRHKIYICETCQTGDGQVPGPDLVRAVQEALEVDVDVTLSPCMNMCDTPVSLALRATGKIAYLFSRVEAQDARDIAALAKLYVEADQGEIIDARPAGRLRYCLTGRVPAI